MMEKSSVAFLINHGHIERVLGNRDQPKVLVSRLVDQSSRMESFTGRGYGHGVGMCVIGAGRRARRGETVEDILHAYYPGLRLATLDAASPRGVRVDQ
jgi:SpoIID/LytB domain protein